MSSHRAAVGMCFDRTFPPTLVTEFAGRLDDGGADQIWIIEDCFYTGGVSLAASALAVTERLTVGLGILPAVARNPAITAMEIATLCHLGARPGDPEVSGPRTIPGRFLPGIGHGVQSWMQQMGVRAPSPLTALDEVLVAVRRLLAGERVTVDGRYVHLDDVQLDQPPIVPPPLLAGVRGPRSLALAGRVAGGVVLAEPASPSYVRWALDQAGQPEPFHVAVYSTLCVAPERNRAHRIMAPWLARLLDKPSAGLQALPFYDELSARYAESGAAGLAGIPADWWRELGPIGTLDDAAAHIAALEAAGAHSIGLFPAPDLAIARSQLDDVLSLAAR